MKNKWPSILWIIAGLLYIYFGLQLYWRYSSGILWLVFIPETWAINWILAGSISLFVGLKLFYQPRKIVGTIFSFPFWTLLLTFWGFLYELIQFSSYRGWADYIFNYFISIPFVVSLIKMRKENIIQTYKSMFEYLKKAWLKIIIQSVAIFTFIQIAAQILHYDIFAFLHE